MTRLYLVCTSHDPEQFSDVIAPTLAGIRGIRETISPAERGHYLTTIDRMGVAQVVERMALYKRNLVEFFAAHPQCEYVLQDDAGYRYNAYCGLDSLVPMSQRFISRNKKSHQDFLDLGKTPPRRPAFPPYLTDYSQYGSPTGRLRTTYHRSTRATGYPEGDHQSDPAHTYIHLLDASHEERAKVLYVKAKSMYNIVLTQPVWDLDGYRVADGDLVLLTNQRNEVENGLYVYYASARHLGRYSTGRREFTTYYVMEGMRWKGTYWGLKSATFPYNKTRSVMSESINTVLSVTEYNEVLDLGDTSAFELDALMEEVGMASHYRKAILHKIYKAKREKSGTVYTLQELVEKDVPYYKLNVIFAGHEGVMTDFLPPREGDGPYNLVIDGRLIQGASYTKITILPKDE